jgi:hypothetical protein
MAAAVIETRLQLPADWGPVPRLTLLVPLGAMIFVFTILVLDRPLVRDFLEFARTAFESKRKRSEMR